VSKGPKPELLIFWIDDRRMNTLTPPPLWGARNRSQEGAERGAGNGKKSSKKVRNEGWKNSLREKNLGGSGRCGKVGFSGQERAHAGSVVREGTGKTYFVAKASCEDRLVFRVVEPITTTPRIALTSGRGLLNQG